MHTWKHVGKQCLFGSQKSSEGADPTDNFSPSHDPLSVFSSFSRPQVALSQVYIVLIPHSIFVIIFWQ